MITNFRQILEEKTGDTLEHRFGKDSEMIIQKVIEEYSISITPELIKAVVSRFYPDPEAVGFVALICPLFVAPITKTVLSKIIGEIYRIILWIWYSATIFRLIVGISKLELLFYGICLVTVSICFRIWTKDYNLICLASTLIKFRK